MYIQHHTVGRSGYADGLFVVREWPVWDPWCRASVLCYNWLKYEVVNGNCWFVIVSSQFENRCNRPICKILTLSFAIQLGLVHKRRHSYFNYLTLMPLVNLKLMSVNPECSPFLRFKVSISPKFYARLFRMKVSHKVFWYLHFRFELFWAQMRS
jgi:hypothetical protein